MKWVIVNMVILIIMLVGIIVLQMAIRQGHDGVTVIHSGVQP